MNPPSRRLKACVQMSYYSGSSGSCQYHLNLKMKLSSKMPKLMGMSSYVILVIGTSLERLASALYSATKSRVWRMKSSETIPSAKKVSALHHVRHTDSQLITSQGTVNKPGSSDTSKRKHLESENPNN